LANLRHKLEEFELMGSYTDIPLREIVSMLNGAENELRRMDAELTQVGITLKEIQQKKEGDGSKKAN
jgi:hypothetical protein